MKVTSVLGSTELTGGGIVLPHEHLIIDYRQKEGGAHPPTRSAEDHVVAVLAEVARTGVEAIVDCTPPGYGRDLAFLRAVSARSGMTILASTGTFCEQWSALPAWVATAEAQTLYQSFAAELDRSCGVVKVATGERMSSRERTALTAAGRTSAATGAPIVSHTTGGLGLEQLDIYKAAGAEPEKVLVSHAGSAGESLEYITALAHRGAYVGLDRIGHAAHDDDYWIRLIKEFIAAGLTDRVLLSQDSVQHFDGPTAIADHTFRQISHLTTVFLQRAAASGIDAQDLRTMTVTNPLRWLGAPAPSRNRAKES